MLSLPFGLLPLAGILIYGKTLDAMLLFSFITLKKRGSIQELVSHIDPAIVITSAKTTITLFILLQVYRYIRNLQRSSSRCAHFPVNPMLFPCETAHVRMFPKKHGFSYSYLLVGIPVGWKGSVGGMISSDVDTKPASWYSRLFSLKPGSAWYTVNGDDYLERGHVEDGLKGKLKQYLESQNIDPQQYTYIYLLTAARFLGYASNPVSIWHLYSSTKELKALILEVNNTFDEKRIYFLEPGHEDFPTTEVEPPKPTRYTGTWPKDFYVSTFNSRNGSYSLSAYDPLFPFMGGAGPINTTITLNNSSSHAKLVARVYSAGAALDPSTMSILQKTRFVASWWWVGLATFPRTVKEALTLLARKKMPWVFRPEPRRETMSRRADETERIIERHFRAYLMYQVEMSDEEVVVRYVSAGLVGDDGKDEIMWSGSAQLMNSRGLEDEVRVLTPLFYARLVQYDSVPEALAAEVLSGTISLPPGLLTKLSFSAMQSRYRSKNKDVQSAIRYDLQFLYRLRKRPAPISVPEKERDGIVQVEGVKEDGYREVASLDHFILMTSSRDEWRVYVKRMLKLMVAEHVAGGWIEILDLEVFLIRAGVAWGLVRMFLS